MFYFMRNMFSCCLVLALALAWTAAAEETVEDAGEH